MVFVLFCAVMVKKSGKEIISVGFVALGCPKNIVDSEKMLAKIGEAGFLITGDIDNADVVVVNTCGFIAPAKAEAIGHIDKAVQRKKAGFVGKVIVAGCLAQRMGDELLGEVEGIDALVGLAGRDDIGRIIEETVASGESGRVYSAEPQEQSHDDRGRLLITPGHWAYLRISEGCNRKCSFCTIPAIRGRFRSKNEKLVLSEARELVGNGAVELSLIAQDSNYYGKDMRVKDGLAGLIKKLEEIEELEWIRLMYLYPAGIDDRLIETIAASEKTLNYIDMPIQHINNAILKDMNRVDRKEKIVRLIEKLRSAMGDVILRTTMIVGFPGESDEQFEELVDFVRWAKFDSLGCFTFYAEKSSAAAKLGGQVPENVKAERAGVLMGQQQEIAFARGRERIGSELICLVDEVGEAGAAQGRFYGQAPHIDGICYIRECSAGPGEFVRTKVVEAQGYDLIVQQIYD